MDFGGWNNLCGPRIRFRVIRGGEGFGRNFQPPIRRTNLQAKPPPLPPACERRFCRCECLCRIKYTSKPDRRRGGRRVKRAATIIIRELICCRDIIDFVVDLLVVRICGYRLTLSLASRLLAITNFDKKKKKDIYSLEKDRRKIDFPSPPPFYYFSSTKYHVSFKNHKIPSRIFSKGNKFPTGDTITRNERSRSPNNTRRSLDASLNDKNIKPKISRE